jgi:hypothetical protein
LIISIKHNEKSYDPILSHAKNRTTFCITLPLKRAFCRAENTSKKERVEKQKTLQTLNK